VTRLKWKLGLVCFGDSATLMQHWWMVCVERTIGSKIVLKAFDGTPR
jgi:hypothetical protein